MKYLDYITGMLNEALSASFECERKNFLGVVQAVRLDGSVEGTTPTRSRIVPGLYLGIGKDVQYAGFDDNYGVCAYHKAVSMNTRRSAQPDYGDSPNRLLLTHNMALVLCADMDKVGMNADQIAMMLQFIFPDALAYNKGLLPQGFYSVNFNVNSTVLSADQVFREEFQNVNFFLGPQHALIKCNYTIESTISRKCFKTASCQSV